MSLKCPICGKEYFYDRKICQTCENKSIISGLVYSDKLISQRWNCSTFLEFESPAFGRRQPDEPYYKIASEPKFYDCKPKIEYSWNCNTRFKVRNLLFLDSEGSQLEDLERLPSADSTALEKGRKVLLIYE